jgi:hypothetical protein
MFPSFASIYNTIRPTNYKSKFDRQSRDISDISMSVSVVNSSTQEHVFEKYEYITPDHAQMLLRVFAARMCAQGIGISHIKSNANEPFIIYMPNNTEMHLVVNSPEETQMHLAMQERNSTTVQ